MHSSLKKMSYLLVIIFTQNSFCDDAIRKCTKASDVATLKRIYDGKAAFYPKVNDGKTRNKFFTYDAGSSKIDIPTNLEISGQHKIGQDLPALPCKSGLFWYFERLVETSDGVYIYHLALQKGGEPDDRDRSYVESLAGTKKLRLGFRANSTGDSPGFANDPRFFAGGYPTGRTFTYLATGEDAYEYVDLSQSYAGNWLYRKEEWAKEGFTEKNFKCKSLIPYIQNRISKDLPPSLLPSAIISCHTDHDDDPKALYPYEVSYRVFFANNPDVGRLWVEGTSAICGEAEENTMKKDFFKNNHDYFYPQNIEIRCHSQIRANGQTGLDFTFIVE